MQCDDCESKCRSSDECGMYQDLEGELMNATTATKKLEANVATWKELAKTRYKKMVGARLKVKELEETIDVMQHRNKWLENNRDFLLEEFYRQAAMLERLK